MTPDHASAFGRVFDALLFGERAALFVAAMTIMIAFWASARRYFSRLAQFNEPSIPDKFGAGIWSATAGMLFTIAVRMAFSTYWRGAWGPLGAGLMAIGVLVIIGGYFLHFAAWSAVAHPSRRRLPLLWTTCMVVVTVAGTVFALNLY